MCIFKELNSGVLARTGEKGTSLFVRSVGQRGRTSCGTAAGRAVVLVPRLGVESWLSLFPATLSQARCSALVCKTGGRRLFGSSQFFRNLPACQSRPVSLGGHEVDVEPRPAWFLAVGCAEPRGRPGAARAAVSPAAARGEPTSSLRFAEATIPHRHQQRAVSPQPWRSRRGVPLPGFALGGPACSPPRGTQRSSAPSARISDLGSPSLRPLGVPEACTRGDRVPRIVEVRRTVSETPGAGLASQRTHALFPVLT